MENKEQQNQLLKDFFMDFKKVIFDDESNPLFMLNL
jgi:hypothetical protein